MMASDDGYIVDLPDNSPNPSLVSSSNPNLAVSREHSETSASTLSLGSVTAPVLAANHIILNTENCNNSKNVGVLVEVHNYYGCGNGNGSKEQQGSIFQLERNALTKLVSKYKEEAGWMYPLPWEKTLKLEPEEFYVELTLDAYSKSGLFSKGVNAKVEEIFDPVLPGGLPVQRVLIQGNAGFGKSSLCQKAVYEWSHGISTFQALPWQTSLPVLMKLRFLDEESNLEELICKFIGLHCSPQAAEQELNPFIKALGRNLIIILDGYDEQEIERQKHVQIILESWKQENSLLNSASLLVTTRPTSDKEFLLMFEKHYFITSISDDNVERLVKKFKKFTYSLIERNAYRIEKLFANVPGNPETRLLEVCLGRVTGKDIRLKGIPPLMIALFCWVISQPQGIFTSNDIVYSCVELLSKRCNEREKFGLSDDNLDEIMFRFGLVFLKAGSTVIAESSLREELGYTFSFVVLTGIVKCSEDHRGITVWEPVHKSFLDALVERILACDGIRNLTRSDVTAFLNGDITSIECEVALHATKAGNICFGRQRIIYNAGLKGVCLKWNHGILFNPHYIQIGAPSGRSQKSVLFNDTQLEVFAKKFLSMLSLVKNHRNIEEFMNDYSSKPHVFSCNLDHSTEDVLALTFTGNKYGSLELLAYRNRKSSLSRSIDNPLCASDEDVLGRKPQRQRSLDDFFSSAHIREDERLNTVLGMKPSFAFMNLFHTLHEYYSEDKITKYGNL